MDALPRSPTASRAGQIIVPTSPQLDSAEGSQREDDESNEADEGIRQDETVFNPLLHSADAGVHDASYSILPAPQRVEPSANLDGLYEQLAESSDSEESVRSQVDLEYQDGYDEDGIDLLAGSYRPAFRPPSIEPERASATIPTFSGTTAYTTTRREGQTSTSAILIQDSPTPPLRPLASPKARLAASNTGRCAALDDAEPIALSDADEKKTSLGELVCPVCLGPPTPLVVTECGHTFCGPCLHAAIVAQPITQQLLQDLPMVAGKNLEGTCPVCRHALSGGWGKSLRGAILKMDFVEVPI